MSEDQDGIRIEFFGIPRQRAGVGSFHVQLRHPRTTLADIIAILSGQFPDLADTCFDGNELKPTYVFNLNGQRFLCNSKEEVESDSTILLLSADAGG